MRSVDVAVVGAGFAGAATAWALRERGIRALVLERETELGRHASGRGAGLGRQLAEDDDTSRLTIRGAQLLRERFRAQWRPTGGFLTFDDAALREGYVARARALQIPHEVVGRAAVNKHWSLDLEIESALLIPSDGVIEIRGLLNAYADDVELGTEVSRVTPTERGARLETNHGVIEARCIVDAAGAWAGQPTQDPPLDVFKRHLYTVQLTAASDAPYLWHLGSHEVYVRPDAGGVLASPCDVERVVAMREHEVSLDADARLSARLPGAFPVTKRWACARSFAPDRKMRIGRDPSRPWLVWAAALGGHGATASAAVGERAAAAVMEVLDERR